MPKDATAYHGKPRHAEDIRDTMKQAARIILNRNGAEVQAVIKLSAWEFDGIMEITRRRGDSFSAIVKRSIRRELNDKGIQPPKVQTPNGADARECPCGREESGSGRDAH